MKIQQFLSHHGVARNPFAEEDAQTDPVFKDYCIVSTYHPTWDKVYGDPTEPATAIVFGEKGSGKTAMRLQITRHLEQFNQQHPERRLFVVQYDDFNPFLDRFREHVSRRRRSAERMLEQFRLWDHIDAMLSLGVTRLVDRVLGERSAGSTGRGVPPAPDVGRLDRFQSRDLLLLAACYDQSLAQSFPMRWDRLRKALGFSVWKSYLPLVLGWTTVVAVAALMIALAIRGHGDWVTWLWPLWIVLTVAGAAPWLWKTWHRFWLARGILKRLRVVRHQARDLQNVLTRLTHRELADQPLPNKDSTDDRYELLLKFQAVLDSLGYPGIIVLVDRVDEPHLINGSAELMRALIWPLLDNKFLKHPGLGLKLMLPIELKRFVDREQRDFFQRARLDKQNMIPSFQWTGEALLDVANARLEACAMDGKRPKLRDLLDESISDARILESLRLLRVPRHLFKFLYRLFVAHGNAYTDDQPRWKITSEVFESTLAVYLRDQDEFDRGVGAG